MDQDTSKEYIAQCQQAKERGLLDGWEPKVGDWTDRGIVVRVSPPRLVTVIKVGPMGGVETHTNPQSHYDFYPSTTQLLRMLPEHRDRIYHLERGLRGTYFACCTTIKGGTFRIEAPTPEQALIKALLEGVQESCLTGG